jgi:hypothetical protein
MSNFTSGIFDKTRLVSNVLMLVLVAGNIFFSIQYIYSIKQEQQQINDTSSTRYMASRALHDFIVIVLSTKGVVSYDDRVKLENDILQVNDPTLTVQWKDFVDSKDSVTAQGRAINVLTTLSKDVL